MNFDNVFQLNIMNKSITRHITPLPRGEGPGVRPFFLLLLSIPLFAIAQVQTLSLDDCLRLAAEKNLEVRRAELAVQRAEDLQRTSFDLEPTSLSLSQDPTSGGSPDNALTLSQTFSLPWAYTAKHKQLKATTEVERGRKALADIAVRSGVKAAYCQLVYEGERLTILQRQDSLYRQFRRIAEAKHQAGETGELECINAERLLRENEVAVRGVKADYAKAQLALMEWLNTDTPIAPTDTKQSPLPSPTLADFSAAQTATATVADGELKVSEAALRQARTEALPTVSLAASTQLVVKGFNPYDVDRSAYSKGDFMGFEVGLNIPLAFGAQRGKVRAAKREVEMARTEREAQLRQVTTAWQQLAKEYEARQATLDYYQREAAPQAAELERISQTAYEQGTIGYVELMQNLQTAIATRLAAAEAVRDYNNTVISIEKFKN